MYFWLGHSPYHALFRDSRLENCNVNEIRNHPLLCEIRVGWLYRDERRATEGERETYGRRSDKVHVHRPPVANGGGPSSPQRETATPLLESRPLSCLSALSGTFISLSAIFFPFFEAEGTLIYLDSLCLGPGWESETSGTGATAVSHSCSSSLPEVSQYPRPHPTSRLISAWRVSRIAPMP